jgi:hypothetical protein
MQFGGANAVFPIVSQAANSAEKSTRGPENRRKKEFFEEKLGKR